MQFIKLTHIFSTTAAFTTAVLLLLLSACNEGTEKVGPDVDNRDTLPVIKSIGVSTLISDSGIIRYKIIAEEWFMYDKRTPTFWSFEKGLFIEKFDEHYHVEAFITADTAYYFDQKRLWELRGRVFVKNLKGETFKTELLYWDQQARLLYSPAFMAIDGETQKLSGYDFKSNEQMTDYSIHSSVGAFPLKEDEQTPEAGEEPLKFQGIKDTASDDDKEL